MSGFNFAAISISIDPPEVDLRDAAPDRGYYTDDLTTPEPPPTTPPAPAVVKPVIGKPVVTPLTRSRSRAVTTGNRC